MLTSNLYINLYFILGYIIQNRFSNPILIKDKKINKNYL